jgi:quercetin dioxygenase-like cupin family protein
MFVKNVFMYGVTASIYFCEEGEGLKWHQHPTPHGHCVIKGRTKLEIRGNPEVEMAIDDGNVELPENIDHQITALESGTIFINMMEGGSAPIDPNLPPPKQGGVLLFDGTVV